MRDKVYAKYNGKCAYCGRNLPKRWHTDHIVPKFRNHCEERVKSWNREKGKDSIDNYNPACPRCNIRKSTYTLEQFRNEISLQVERLKRDSNQFNLALDFGLITETKEEVKFYFEKIQKNE